MSFNVYVRSAHADNLPATVRPTDVHLYFQIDNWHDKGALRSQSEVAQTNIQLPLDVSLLSAVRVVNGYKTISDVVVTSTNNEGESDLPCMEDGRSRRYLIGLGNFYQIVSVPINDCHLPIAFTNLSTKDTLTTGATFQLRFFQIGTLVIELMVVFIGGKNLNDDEKNSIDDYRRDITSFMESLASIRDELYQWRSKAERRVREFVMLYYKDHASPAESFDFIAFNAYYGKKFNLIQRSERSFMRGEGWNDIIGHYSSSPKFTVSCVLHGYDDHQPALFRIGTFCAPVSFSDEFTFSREFRIIKDNATTSAYRSYKKSERIGEADYRLIRAKHPITYP